MPDNESVVGQKKPCINLNDICIDDILDPLKKLNLLLTFLHICEM